MLLYPLYDCNESSIITNIYQCPTTRFIITEFVEKHNNNMFTYTN